MSMSVTEGFLRHLLTELRLSPRSVRTYRIILRLFCAFADRDPLSADKGLLADYLCALYDRKVTPRTAYQHLSVLRCFYTWAISAGLTRTNPAREVRSPKLPPLLPDPVSADHVARMLAAARNSHHDSARRDAAMLELAYSCGLRRSELLALDVGDLDLNAGQLVVRRGKGGKSRICYLTRAATEAVRSYLVTRDRPSNRQPLFVALETTRRLSASTLRRAFARWAERAGVPDVHPHQFRHSFATHLLDGGADIRVVQVLMGHKHLATTQIYTQVSDRLARETFYRAHPRA